MKIRPGVPDDAGALGVLIAAGLTDAPSSLVELSEIGQDLALLGRDVLRNSLYGAQPLLVAESGSTIVGAARVMPREFARSSHIASITLLVLPRFRRRGIAAALMKALIDECRDIPSIERMELAVSGEDIALRGLVEACAFTLERVERGALMTADGPKDLLIYARDPT